MSHAAQAGADALLRAVPSYVNPRPEGIIAHIRGIVQATELPVVLYDLPVHPTPCGLSSRPSAMGPQSRTVLPSPRVMATLGSAD